MKKLVIVLVAVCAVATVGTASAKELGDRGTLALTGGGMVQSASGPASSENTFVILSPSLHWFFADGASVSIGPRYSHVRSRYDDHTSQSVEGIGGEIRLGGLVDLSEHVSLWPQIGVHLDSVKSNFTGATYQQAADGSSTPIPYSFDKDATNYGVTVEVPVVLKLSQHMFATLSFATAGYEKTRGADGQSSHGASIAINPGFGIGIGGWF